MQSKILQFYRKHNVGIQDINLIKSHLFSKDHLNKWIYCIETELFNVYNNVCPQCVLVGCVPDETHIEMQIMKYPKSKVIFRIQLHESNTTFELLKIMLGKYIVKQLDYGSANGVQTLLCENKKKVIEKLNILSKTKSLEEYFEKVMGPGVKTVEPKFLTRLDELNAFIFEPFIKKNNWKKEYDDKAILTSINNYKSTIRKYGFLVMIENFEITEYYSNKIVGVFAVTRYSDIENICFYKSKIVKSIRVFDKDFAYLIFNYLMAHAIYCPNYLTIRKTDAEDTLDVIKKYFTDYQTIDDVRKHVLKNNTAIK